MSIWNKVVTAIRGGVNEAGEAIVDSQALRILDQEIRDADGELRRSKEGLANMMAKHKLSQNKVDGLQAKITEYEGYAMQAMDKGDDVLATDVAEKIAELENQFASEKDMADQYATSVADLRRAVSQAEGNLRRLKQQVDVVKATESVHKAQAAVAHRHSGANSKMRTAVDSLERIKQKQAERSAQMDAASELANEAGEGSLDAKLKAAGIGKGESDRSAVLARLKAKRG